MKILYAIQGTGNGHISRAREIIPVLQQYGEVNLLISGTQADVKLTQPVRHQLHGFSFIFGKKGGVDHYATWRQMNLPRLVKDMRSIPLKDYDLVLNDFEPVTAWACRLKGITSVALSHQASFFSPLVPKATGAGWEKMILKYYAPATRHIGFHFEPYDDFIHTPVIRKAIRELKITNAGHYTVYLPAMDEKHLLPLLHQFSDQQWHVFSKHSRQEYVSANVWVRPVHHDQFNASLASAAGLLTGGGFEGPSEALFLGKKLLVIPMKSQYEQHCNAFALEKMGFPVIWPGQKKWEGIIRSWLAMPEGRCYNFPDETSVVIDKLVSSFAR
ncbi:glycosyltransferase family protein [Pedobacter antarcticus]|uniref:glycosyltransferase family protein n=1 Tax=Pedobacter antarcticus TaxID=34086 RepID=UPI000889662C|nr:glycosyltransferase family protein [Pedobacter antarcticus]SDM19088.1 conserved hypothetical protein [Pedobacter antarcticus]